MCAAGSQLPWHAAARIFAAGPCCPWHGCSFSLAQMRQPCTRAAAALLTIAASAGDWGLWDVLVRNAPDLALSLAARCHAGRTLMGAMGSCMRDGEHNILGSVIAFLQSSFAARGQQQLFLQQVNAPLEAAADIFGLAFDVHMLFGSRVHALCLPLLSSTGRGCKNAVQLLLQAGVTPGALKLGKAAVPA